MSKRKYFYKITEKGGIWTAKGFYKDKAYIMFQEKVKNLKQFANSALMTTKENGKHDLYLPTNSGGSHIYVDVKCIPFLTDIESYQYSNGMFLLRMKDYITFVNRNCGYNLSKEGIIEIRRKNLTKIYCKEAFIREDLSCLSYEFLLGHPFICNVDGNDYVIEKPIYGGEEEILKPHNLNGRVEQLPGVNGGFKIITSNGESMFESAPLDYEILGRFGSLEKYHSIEPFLEEDYNPVFNKDDYTGYWFKNSDGNITRVSFYQNNLFAYDGLKIEFLKPIKSMKFLKNKFNNIPVKAKIGAWKIVDEDGKKIVMIIYLTKTISSIEQYRISSTLFVKEDEFM